MSVKAIASSNLLRLNRILKRRNDPDYTATFDKRMEPDYPRAEIVEDVKIGAEGAMLPRNVPASEVLIKVDLSYVPGEPDPLEVYPCDPDRLGRKNTREEKGIFTLSDIVLAKYPALFKAIDQFNSEELVVKKEAV